MQMILRTFAAIACASGLFLLSGCGLPTWGDLTGAKKEEALPVVVVPPQQFQAPPPQTPPPPPPPPKPDPAQVIADFQALPTHQISDSTLKQLTSLDEGLEVIEELKLQGSTVTTAGIKDLHRLTHLARLDLRGTQLEQSAFPFIGQTASITELHVDGSRMTAQAAADLQPLKELKVFAADRMQMTPLAWQDFFNHHPEIENLSLSGSNLIDPLMPFVGRLKNLKRLVISNTSISDTGLAALADLDELESLIISSCPINGSGFRPPGGSKAFTRLRELNMSTTPLDVPGAKAIAQMKELQVLYVGDMPRMMDMHLQQMVRPLRKLEYLNVAHNSSLTSQCVLAVAGNENLRELIVSGCPRIDDVALKHLGKCKSLKRLDIQETGCSVEGILKFRDQLPDVEVVVQQF